ncbi:MAG: gephyrin-like molybdotransferase Glp [Acidimicrobiia bacterium]
MVSLEEARAHVLGLAGRLAPVEVPLADALGLVTAAEVRSPEAVPPFANTAVDGYAVRAADTARAADTTATPVELAVVGMLPAGVAPSRAVGPGEAIRIMTGAPIPPGADAVVMVEDTVIVTTSVGGETVRIGRSVDVGSGVRPVGDDVRSGDLVVATGIELTPGHLGVLASVGVDRVLAHPRPRVGVLSTGDELVEGGGALQPGQIREANRPALLGLLRRSGFDAVDLGIAADEEEAVTAALRDGVARCDLVLTSGGVSMGDLDFVKVVLDGIGEMRWLQIAIKPAKPLAAGVVDGIPVIGLPGNPVSSMVSFELFARPLLRKMAGQPGLDRPSVVAVAPDGFRRSPDGKTHFDRVIATMADDGTWTVRSAGGQGSHQLTAMAAANALAVVPDGNGVEPGGRVWALLLSWT